MDNSGSGVVQVFVGEWSPEYEALSIKATKQTSSAEIVECIIERLGLVDASISNGYELAEVVGNSVGQECKERRLGPAECPVALMLLWPKNDTQQEYYRFYLRKKQPDLWSDSRFPMDPQLLKDYFNRFLFQPRDKEYPDLCQLPDLNEQTLLDNLRARFLAGNIYTYVGSILIALNPFKFYPIYNPKYVKLYQNRRLGPDIPPHIFAIADAAYHCMLKEKKNQCIVISGESGSGKTESTNFLLHHLTALSQKGSHGSGVEQTILSAGPVLEAFGNAKTAHNNNSSRFGKFIQVNYKENGMVHGAVVQKYLLEKSRIVSQGRNERNYHVFYYLLAGANEQEKQLLHLEGCDRYNYLNKSGCYGLENIDERHEFSRLKQSMEMVGFTAEKQRRLFAVLSAVLLLGNVEFHPRKSYHHHDEAVGVKNPEVVALISELLRVKQETLLAALTAKRARASGETLVINYRLPEAIAARDAMAKCLYGALFDWIVLQVNHALLSKKDTLRDHQGNSIGVLDIFGFEDFKTCNSFEQLCINYANEQLQHYFNQHVFQYEQREYRKQGIRWTDIGYSDNSGCLNLIEGKPNGLLCLLDDQCNFPGATNETLLQKFNTVHKDNPFYEAPQRREAAFVVRHYAGAVKYQAANMREKNLDLMRPDGVVGVLKNSSLAFVRELVGADPVAVFRWAILRAFFRAHFAFQEAGRAHRHGRVDGSKTSVQNRYRTPNENLISSHKHTRPLSYQKQRSVCLPPATTPSTTLSSIQTENNDNINNNRLSWPQFRNINQTQHLSNVTSTKGGYVLRGREDQSHINNKFRRDIHTPLERVLPKDEANVMERANQIVMKNKSFRPRERGKKGLKNLQTVKTLAGRTQSYGTGPGKARKQPMTVSAQFQQSLHSLMDTLNQANPFFIRCIKSNANKVPNEFDEETVQRQLRYTGMLETVRIRQAGFNVRLTYEEFIQLYRMLLPKGLLSSQSDVRDFLLTLNLNRDNYQLGTTKVFLRESEKIKLDIELHQQIITSITTIQKWFRACLERRKFLRLKNAIIQIQSFWRMVSAQRLAQVLRARTEAALHIQTAWRMYKQHSWFKKLKSCVIIFQAYVRGNNARKKFDKLKRRKRSLPDKIQEVKKVQEYKELVYDKVCAKDNEELFAEDRSLTEYGESPRKVESPNRPMSARGDNAYRDSTLDTTISYSKRKLTPNKRILRDTPLKNTETHHFDEITERKSSLESLTSLRSYESQASVNSSESQENSGSRPVPSTRTKRGDHSSTVVNLLNASSRHSSVSRRTDSSSTGYSDGEAESETPSAVQSAPPVFNTSPPFIGSRDIEYHSANVNLTHSPNSDIWRRRIDYSPANYSDFMPVTQKTTITRSANVSHYKNVTDNVFEQTRHEKPNEAANYNVKLDTSDRFVQMESLASGRQQRGLNDNNVANERMENIPISPIKRDQTKHGSTKNVKDLSYLRRQNSEGDTTMKVVDVDDSALKSTLLRGSSPRERNSRSKEKYEPDVPVRNARRNRPSREVQCRSMGESAVETNTDTRNLLLGTIKESDLNKTTNVWCRKEYPHETASRSVTDWPMNKNEGTYKIQQPGKRMRSNAITTLELRRRNSDPATKISGLSEDKMGQDTSSNDLKLAPGMNLLEWKGNNLFTLAGHRFRKVARFAKDDVCVCCHEKMDAFVTQGYKCVDCKQLYHVKCIQNGGVLKMPCLLANTPSRRKNRKPPRTPYDTTKQTVASKFNLTGTSAFSDSTDKIISDAKELALMQDFITKKIYKMESQEEGRKPSEVDRVFKQALRKFKDDLVITYSVAIQQGVEGNIKYTDLIANFLHVMETVCKQENTREDFPVTMGVNAFRGFMNEFMAMVKTEALEKQSKSKRKKEKKRKQEEPIRHGSHMFQLTIINIPTACEVCTSFFMWPIERGLVCQNCKLTCHKKCYIKASAECGKDGSLLETNSHKVFGVPLYKLDCGDGKVPLVVDRLITTIEMHGLYTEGIYRKSGVSSKVRELKMKMDEGDLEKVDFENYQVHVLAAVLKSFFRDMPEPLLTYEYYDDFLHAANLTDPHDRIGTLFAILKKLPKPNYDLMERLIVHLARVARHEVDNRMSPSALAIVFAPCILRTNRTLPAQDSLQDVGRQTRCVETIVQEKLRVVRATLADINTLESACHTATHRLSSLRSSKIFSPEELNVAAASAAGRAAAMDRDRDRGDEEEALLVDHIQEIQKEKALLTSTLPSLTRASSDDDLLLSATDLDDGSLDDLLPSSADGLVRKKPVQRQSSADNSFPTIINMDDDMVMV
ncbi:unconventional myosin-IXa isoform X1 [Monomorium pharaonis]|uniref:unconventional myosin-IXa isoform X1 n=1 Tax=Monomorium pharaonis TaxID=307658 RepID=UPI00063EEE8F|nr:unconventional myosin-IXa isoform X1 [Monomorium pharaonis]XP_012530086.1 unconventional myosin-IXa isoform X1 [Monomorium pharaonis]XP_012530087.1 unconventional myosin-IXa isoform X1 [Monomorium pharaonis]XP_028046565.1 unconventional myosin-IXa isoform X1 [Monomorium pharaonis]